MKTLYIPLLLLFLAGCTSKSQLFVNANGDVKRCASFGTGLVGIIQAENIQSDCERDMLNLGYKKIEMAGVVGITMNDSLRIIKVNPRTPIKNISVGDYLVAVDGEKVYTSKEARQLLFDDWNTKVKLTINHGGIETTQTVTRKPYITVYGER